MQVVVEFTVSGDPVPKGRPRFGAGGHVITPARTRTAEQVVSWLARRAMGGRAPTGGDLGVAVEFYCATKRRVDGDNLLKLVTDAMNGIVYGDDVQLVEYFARVHRGVGKNAARSDIVVFRPDI